MDPTLSSLYFPTAIVLGALHALEPGHAKTLTAAYLIGIKGTRTDAILLGLAVATTHSLVVVALTGAALFAGEEALADDAIVYLQQLSAVLVIVLGVWMAWARMPWGAQHGHSHSHGPDHAHDHEHGPLDGVPHDHADLDAHARAHLATIPDYARRGERPTAAQILAFGAAGGLVPCPAAITVMLLATSLGRVSWGLLTVLGFSLGLALALVGVGLAVVAGARRFEGHSRWRWIGRAAPFASALVVIATGVLSLVLAHRHVH